MRSAWIVAQKEIRETLRDRRTLLIMVGVPVLLYPVLLVVSQQLAILGLRRAEAEPVRIALVGADAGTLQGRLEADDRLEIGQLPGFAPDGVASAAAPTRPDDWIADAATAVRGGGLDAVAVLSEEPSEEGTVSATLLFDETRERSQRARSILRDALAAWGDELFEARLRERGLPSTFGRPLEVADSSLAQPSERGGYLLGRILPVLLIVITLLGAYHPAIDLAAGEKERGTLETLLTSPAPAFSIVMGKFVTVALVALLAAGLNLGSMLLTFRTGLFQLPADAVLDFAIPPVALLWVCVLLVPLAALFAAVFLGIAVRSQSFKEAQNTLSPVMLFVLLPAVLPILPGTELTPALALVPVAGPALLFRELMSANAGLGMVLLVLAATAVYALLGLWFAADAFGRETILFGSGESEAPSGGFRERIRGWRSGGREPRPVHALLLLGVVAVLNLFGAPFLGMALGLELALLATQWLFVFVPAVAFVLVFGFDPVRTLSLHRPSSRQLVGALLLIAGGTTIAWFLSWLQSIVMPVPDELVEAIERLVRADSPGRLLWLIFLAAITPAFAEEFVFRGVLLGSTRASMGAWRAIALNAFVFGIFHLSIVRLLPTAWLGLLFAWVVWRTRSIWTSIVMHAVNNGLIVVLASLPATRAWSTDTVESPPWLLAPIGLLLLVWGIRILRESPPAGDGAG